VDDNVAISHAPHGILDVIAQKVTLKPGSIEEPKHYLGANISRCTVLDGNGELPMKQVWTISAQEYIKRAIEEVGRELNESGQFLPKKNRDAIIFGVSPRVGFYA